MMVSTSYPAATTTGPGVGREHGGLIQKFSGHVGPVLSIAFSQYKYRNPSPDDKIDRLKKLVLTGSDGTVILWTWSSGKRTLIYGHKGAVNSVAFIQMERKPDKKPFSGGEDGTLYLWNIGTGMPVRSWSATPVR